MAIISNGRRYEEGVQPDSQATETQNVQSDASAEEPQTETSEEVVTSQQNEGRPASYAPLAEAQQTEEPGEEPAEEPKSSKNEDISSFFNETEGFDSQELDLNIESKTITEAQLEEAEYQGRKVKLNKPMQGDGDSKFKVYVKDGEKKNADGTMKVKKVSFGAKGSENRIKKDNPARRKSFRARHNCDNPGPKTKARYWSCKKW